MSWWEGIKNLFSSDNPNASWAWDQQGESTQTGTPGQQGYVLPKFDQPLRQPVQLDPHEHLYYGPMPTHDKEMVNYLRQRAKDRIKGKDVGGQDTFIPWGTMIAEKFLPENRPKGYGATGVWNPNRDWKDQYIEYARSTGTGNLGDSMRMEKKSLEKYLGHLVADKPKKGSGSGAVKGPPFKHDWQRPELPVFQQAPPVQWDSRDPHPPPPAPAEQVQRYDRDKAKYAKLVGF